MKKFSYSIVALATMSIFSVANASDKVEGLYAGIGYGYINTDVDAILSGDVYSLELEQNSLMLQAGYQAHPNLAIEWRYWSVVGDSTVSLSIDGVDQGSADEDMDASAWGIYAKPMYPLTNEVTAYALLGYGGVELEGEDDSGFQWGIGASMDVNTNLAVFVDYVHLYDDSSSYYDDSGDMSTDSINFGLTYKFN